MNRDRGTTRGLRWRPALAGRIRSRWRTGCAAAAVWAICGGICSAQSLTQRGFVEGRVLWFPQDTANDSVNLVGDMLAREEVAFKAASWLQFNASGEFRADSHDQVRTDWSIDFFDRDLRRSMIGIRRVSATVTKGRLTIDAGKQFFRWGKTDIVAPTDRFSPRDFLNVVFTDFLPVTGVRADVLAGAETFEAIWVPVFTPSRAPLITQRWSGLPDLPPGVIVTELTEPFPERDQFGIRWSHSGGGYEYALSYFDGINHLPDTSGTFAGSVITIVRRHPFIRTYGADIAVPTVWATFKGEAAYTMSTDHRSDDYVIYVVQAERQQGEWLFIGGYVGEHATATRAPSSFSPDRGVAESFIARAAYTIDTNRSAAIEALVRQNGDGLYTKGEYSWARGQHWRTTVMAALIRGEADDFLGQYRNNSYLGLTLRYSF